MKTLFKILFLGVITVLLTIAAMAKEKDPIRLKPLNSKDKNLFVFKADRDLIGAKVEILRENGSVIAEQVLTRRKLVIDFNDITSGFYTIRLVKGETIQELSYEKK
jgi:hypothetical protein